MPDTFQYPQRELTNREQRLVDKQAAGKRLSARQQQEIAELDDRELKRFTDQELKDLSENELKEIITKSMRLGVKAKLVNQAL